jgi:hypothetical protein
VWRDDVCGTSMKGNDDDGWSSDGVVFILGRRQNRDTIECWKEWLRLKWHFYSSGGWESGGPGRVARGDSADSMFQFRLERQGDRMKHCGKMRRRQWARLDSMGRKCDTTWQCGDVGRMRGDTEEREMEETTLVGLTWILLDQKWKKIPQCRFSWYKWAVKI